VLATWYVVLQRILQLISLLVGRRSLKNSRSSCFATNWRCCAARSDGRCSGRRIASSWRLQADCCRASGGRRVLVTPTALLDWQHRRLVANWWTYGSTADWPCGSRSDCSVDPREPALGPHHAGVSRDGTHVIHNGTDHQTLERFEAHLFRHIFGTAPADVSRMCKVVWVSPIA